MYLDFSKIDLNTWLEEFGSDPYFNTVLCFLQDFIGGTNFSTFTSGSTGEPKRIEIDTIKAVASARLSNAFFHIDSTTQFLLCLDIQFIGAKMLLIRAWLAKAKVEVVKPSLEFYKYCVGENFDFVSLTPLHVYKILENSPSFFKRVHTCLLGGSSVHPSLENDLKYQNNKTQFYESFAMTETLSHFALRNINSNQTYFQLLDGFEISTDADACLEVFHPIILPETIRTNDLVEILPDRRFRYIGRRDNVINSAGLKISPEQLEKEWSLFLPVKFIVAGEPHSIFQQQIILIVADSSTVNREYIIQCLEKNAVPARWRPKEIYYSASWQETASLKPIRSEIMKGLRPLN